MNVERADQNKLDQGGVFTFVWLYGRPYLKHVLLGAILLLATNALAMLIPWQFKRAIDELELSGAVTPLFTQAIILLFVAAILQGVVRVVSRWVIFGIGRSVEADIRDDLYTFLLRQEPRYFDGQSVGDMLSRLANDTNSVRALFGFSLLNVMNTIFVLVMSITIMLSIDTWLTMCALVGFPIIFFVMSRFGKALQRTFLSLQQELGAFSSFLQEGISGIELIQVFGNTKVFTEMFALRNDSYYEVNLSLARIRSAMAPITVFIAGLSGLIVLALGSYQVIQHKMTLGDFVAFQGYLALLVWPTLIFGWLFNTLQRGIASLKRLRELMEKPIELPTGTSQIIGELTNHLQGLPTNGDLLSLEGVSVTIGGDKHGRKEFYLGPVSMAVKPGKWVGVAGPTGAGKSTLLQAMMGYYLPESGKMRLAGIEITAEKMKAYRLQVAYVSTTPLMFSGTIRENLSVIREFPIAEPELFAALEEAAFLDDLAGFPEGIDTVIGEKGLTLSGGQRQRLGIARALLLNREVLILDDALSAVDAVIEEQICANLKKRSNMAVVSATHRASMLSKCDFVLTLRDGRQVEWGEQQKLLESGGLYAQLHATMYLESHLVDDEVPQ